jgi:hypothetical protein
MTRVASIVLILLAWRVTCAQLLVRSSHADLGSEKEVLVTLSPVVREDRGAMSLVTVAYGAPLTQSVSYTVEVSGIERFNTSGVVVAPRGEHISVYQSASYKPVHGGAANSPLVFTLSGFGIWDEHTLENVTREWDMDTQVTLGDRSIIGFTAVQRTDEISSPIRLGDHTVTPGNHTMRHAMLRYSAPANPRFTPYAEVVAGTYYANTARYSLRAGEHFNLWRRLSGFADAEFSRVEGEKPVHGWMVRVKMDWKINNHFSTGAFVLNNSFKAFNGVLAYVQYARPHHSLRLEYREVRDAWSWEESTHPFFSSHVLVQYRYTVGRRAI